MRRLMVTSLEVEGLPWMEAESASKAIARIRDQRPDVVVDFNMPDMNGIELICNVKADPSLKSIPVVMFSGYGEGL